jgi:hypothetical protein
VADVLWQQQRNAPRLSRPPIVLLISVFVIKVTEIQVQQSVSVQESPQFIRDQFSFLPLLSGPYDRKGGGVL